MKKQVITMEQLKKENPYRYTKIYLALEKNRIKKSPKVKIEFSKDILEKYILDNIRK